MKADQSTLPDAVMDADIAILGRKGGGKSYTAKGIVERMLDMGRRVLILDPLGVWAGLRTSADGQKPGYPVAIFGGEHADMPLDPAAAAALAQIIAKENLPAVIDLSELSKSQQGLFLFRFLGELRKVNREALTIVLEEADVFAPQNPQGDDSKALHGEIDWIARRGRFRGFRLMTITQRPARLSKDVLTQANTLIIHRLPAPQDRDAARAWVDGNGDRDKSKQVFDTLAGLKVGEAWVLSQEPEMLERMRFPAIRTLDTSSTPKAGEARVKAKTLAQVDLSGIKTALAEAAAAEKKPAKAARAADEPMDAAMIAEAGRRGYEEGYRAGYVANHHQAVGYIERLRDRVADNFAVTLGSLGATKGGGVVAGDASLKVEVNPTAGAVEQLRDLARKHAPKPRGAPADAGAMPTVAKKIVDAIDMSPARAFTWTQVAMLAGYSESGGQFRRGKKWLIEAGTVVEEGGRVQVAKPSGKTPAPTGADLVRFWCGKLPGVGAAILGALYENRVASGAPRAAWGLDRVAAKLGYVASGGQFRRGVKALRDAGIVDSTGGAIAFTAEFCELAGLA